MTTQADEKAAQAAASEALSLYPTPPQMLRDLSLATGCRVNGRVVEQAHVDDIREQIDRAQAEGDTDRVAALRKAHKGLDLAAGEESTDVDTDEVESLRRQLAEALQRAEAAEAAAASTSTSSTSKGAAGASKGK